MKKIILMLAILSSATTYAKKVKFAVDMTGQVINTTGIHVAGDFQTVAGFSGGDWNSGTTTMLQEGSTNIYSVVVDIPAFNKYEYKFVNGDQFYEAEFVPEPSRVGYNFNDNRWLYVDSLADDTTFVGAILFGGNAPTGLYLLRTLVDMTIINNVSTDGIHLAGSFQGWNPQTVRLYSFGDDVFEVISYVSAGTYEYKFYNGNTIADAEVVPGICSVNSSRSVTVNADTVLPNMCYASCTQCIAASVADRNDKTFNVFPNPAQDKVSLIFSYPSVRSVILTDLSGKIVKELLNISDNTMVIDRNSLSNGVYLLRITDADSNISGGQIIFN